MKEFIGNFYGSALVQQTSKLGGSRDVFVKLQDLKNEYAWPTFGGRIANPFPGKAKIYAGDLAWFKTDDKGVKPAYYILKTYEVASTADSGKTLNIKRDGYRHIPFVGDLLMSAPSTIGGAGVAQEVATVKAATVTISDAPVDVWQITTKTAISGASAGTILVEAEANAATTGSTDTHKMLVENINSVAPCDYDFRFDDVAAGDSADEFDAARYYVTFALGGLMYTHKMSPLPKCVKDLNTVNVNGWYQVDFRTKPSKLQ